MHRLHHQLFLLLLIMTGRIVDSVYNGVAILGGGLAGLMASRRLRSLGIDSFILEAKRRPGGRLQTLDYGQSHVEAGPVSFGDAEPLINGLVNQFRLETVPSKLPHGERPVYQWQGQFHHWRDLPGLSTMEAEAGSDFATFLKFARNDILKLVHEPTVWPADLMALDRIPISAYLRSVGVSDSAAEAIQRGLLGLCQPNASALVSLIFAAQYKDSTRFSALRDGNDRLATAMAEDAQVHYGANVTHVELGKDGVTIKYWQGGMKKKLVAPVAICTIPFSALRQIEIVGISNEKQEVIDRLPYTSVDKNYFRAALWPKPAALGSRVAVISDVSVPLWIENPTWSQETSQILEVHHVGDLPLDIQSFGRKSLQEIFGEDFCFGLSYLGGVGWSGTEGAYAAYPRGNFIRYFNAARRREGPLLFAGEHTAWRLASMEGALQSGLQAADQAERMLRNGLATMFHRL